LDRQSQWDTTLHLLASYLTHLSSPFSPFCTIHTYIHTFSSPHFSHSSATHVSTFTSLGKPLPLLPPPQYAHTPWDPTTMLRLPLPSQAKGFHSTPILASHCAVLLFLLLILYHAARDIG